MKDIIPYGKHFIDQDDIDSVVDILKNHNLTQGKAVDAFEEAVAKFVGAKYAVAVLEHLGQSPPGFVGEYRWENFGCTQQPPDRGVP